MSQQNQRNDFESLSNNEVILSLWSPSAVEKCRLGLSDCVLFENGHPHRWYVTGSAGEVKPKRNIDTKTISQRWMKISEELSTNYVAAVKQSGGLIKFLTKDAWENFIAETRFDPNLCSAHCFLGAGSNCLIYRSTYNLNLQTKRWKISTHTYTVPFQEPVCVISEEKLVLNESRASSINKVTDLATTTVVRYVEKMLKVQIVQCVVDYVIDRKSQIWMLWSSNVLLHRFLPPIDQFEGTINMKTSSPTSRVQTPGSPFYREENQTSAQLLSHQLHDMVQNNVTSKKDPKISQVATIAATHSFGSLDEQSLAAKSKFPHPFNCRGDYCQLEISNTGQLAVDDKQAGLHFAQKLFTDQEIQRLKKDPKFNNMMEFGSAGIGLAEINMRSIIQARNEKRGLLSTSVDSSSWMEYPSSTSKGLSFKGSMLEQDSLVRNKKNRASVWDAEPLRDAPTDDGMPSNLMTHYETVKVCGTCYNVYQCLDWARNLLEASNKDKEAKSAKALSNTMDSHSSTIEDPLRTSFPDRGINSPERPRSQGRLNRGLRPSSTKDGHAKATWKSRLSTLQDRKMKRSEMAVLENYVRGKTNTLSADPSQSSFVASPKRRNRSPSQIRHQTQSLTSNQSSSIVEEDSELYIGQILLACGAQYEGELAQNILIEAGFSVQWFKEGRIATNEIVENWDRYDCIIVERDLPLMNAFEVSRSVRDHEKKMRLEKSLQAQKSSDSSLNAKFLNHRIPLICYTSAVTPPDLTSYMKADMDGCISQPVDKVSLINTMRAAIPHHLAPLIKPEITKEQLRDQQKIKKIGLLGELEDSVDSASMALKTLPLVKNDIGSEFQGLAQLDADTKIPFMIINGSKYSRMKNVMNERFFNLVVCHDLFDTYERMKILLQPIIQRYQSIQILVWNYPGQAHTEWRKTQILNNEYLAACLNELLGQIGEFGTKDFDTNHPFYILGYGYGASIASYYLANYRVPNVRGLLSVNGWAFIDSYLAGVMHDCMNIFQSSPETRPDLPVYFFSRFLFSKDYLAKVSVPLALNIYTAVYNAISIKGRIQLCQGVLKSVDLRPFLKSMDIPLICIHSSQDSFARPLHVEPFVTHRHGEVRSIYQALLSPLKTCVVWLNGGHEVFQENRKQIVLLLEQILTGYHEVHEITFPSASSMNLDVSYNPFNKSASNKEKQGNLGGLDTTKSLEDKFTKSVLNIASKADVKQNTIPSFTHQTQSGDFEILPPNRSISSRGGEKTRSQAIDREMKNMTLPAIATARGNGASWNQYSRSILTKQNDLLTLETKGTSNTRKGNSNILSASAPGELQKATLKDTERMENLSYLSDVKAYPEVKEYMNWRLKRNKKRLQRLQLAAQAIQNAFRAYLARNLVKNIRRKRAALTIQRIFRGWKGRRRFFHQAKRLWAAIIIARTWRGYAARKWYFLTRLKIAAAANIQRIFRGYRARERVKAIRKMMNHAASIIQAMVRRYRARKEAWKRRQLRNGAITIQRIFRGFLGRKKAIAERDKYIFSKSQSQGIEFGRQMLLEHKLHVTRLQSDVTLLAQEKVTCEEQIEALLEEISGFEEGVRTLEKEMHQLSKVESEAAAFMDEDSRFELREQKMRLDREFGEMLSKIANRKDMLVDLEKKLAAIDKTRQAKEEDLRTLERKLVVLLEDQQKELNAIRRKQDVRGALLAASHSELSRATTTGVSAVAKGGTAGGIGGGGYSGGPSLQEKKQAAQLMQSTETLMKFGFMSMSMTYFSSLNMIKALRTVSAQDTVMAALADVHAQRAVGLDTSGGLPSSAPKNPLVEKEAKVNRLKPGQLPGQQTLQVSSWSVEDVAKWLQTLSLGQYSEAFIDSAVDGEFLYDLTDDDLKNTLGIEHRLHRKKILNCVNRLKMAEAQNESRLGVLQNTLFNPDNAGMDMRGDSGTGSGGVQRPNFDGVSSDGGADAADRTMEGPKVSLQELFSLVRHSKFSLLKEAIDYLPTKPFDKSLIQVRQTESFNCPELTQLFTRHNMLLIMVQCM